MAKKITTQVEIKKLEELPYDQFSRLHWVSEFINYLKVQNNIKQASILDVGGNHGYTSQFLSEDIVKILDVEDDAVDAENYIRGDGTDIPLGDDEFDFVVSFETYEHIPRSKRRKFLDEMLRVSKFGFFLTAPFNANNDMTTYAEETANNYYRTVKNKDHRWLKEHLDLVTPKITEIKEQLNAQKSNYCYISSNNLELWLTLLEFHFLAEYEFQNELVSATQRINKFYNQNVKNIDIVSEGEGYRQIFFVSKLKKNVDIVQGQMNDLLPNKGKADITRIQLIDRINVEVFKAMEAKSKDVARKQKDYDELHAEYLKQRQAIIKLDEEIAYIYSSIVVRLIRRANLFKNKSTNKQR